MRRRAVRSTSHLVADVVQCGLCVTNVRGKVRAGLEECRRSGVAAVFVVGHPSYYPRFGFAPAPKFAFNCEFDVPDEAFMAAELIPEVLAGHSETVQFHEAFRNA